VVENQRGTLGHDMEREVWFWLCHWTTNESIMYRRMEWMLWKAKSGSWKLETWNGYAWLQQDKWKSNSIFFIFIHFLGWHRVIFFNLFSY
jgi:hypothetical protein